MKKLYLLLSVLFLIYWGCEDEQSEEVDTTPPTVSITSHSSGQSVYEIVTIVVTTQDNDGISKVDFFIDDSLVLTDMESPYQYDWNTVPYQEDSEHIIKVISYDHSDNSTESQPIMVTVKNNLRKPTPITIESVVFENGGNTITWSQSLDSDFKFYELKKSQISDMSDYKTIFSSELITDTVFIDNEIDPLNFEYYQIKVTDSVSLSTDGDIYSTSLDPIPEPVNVLSVDYTLEEMIIVWGKSQDLDFKNYKIMFSESEVGEKIYLETISILSDTTYSIYNFNPNIENWYWVEVSDTLGQTSIGTGMTNSLNNQPISVNVNLVTYDLELMTINWEDYVPNLSRINQMNQNTRSTVTNDFVSYELLQSDSEDGTYLSVIIITDQSTTSYSLTEYDPTQENWFKVKVTDYWGLNSTGTGMTNEIESPPSPSELYPITYNDGFQISWSQNNDDDFQSYKLYESLSEDMSNQTLVYETTERLDSNYVVTGINEMRYYQIKIEDHWGLQSTSNIEVGDYGVELWAEYYSIEHTTELDLSNRGLTGDIPSEIGNLTNLTYLDLRNNQLTGSIPPEIGNLTNLTILNLRNNQLLGSIPPQIGNLTNLDYLDLKSNDLTGSIPSEIGNLTNLTYLDLRWNDLTGSIPPQIGNLTNLTYLLLSSNDLTGSIPPEIGNLTNLTSLSLSNNQLTGIIPDEICNQGDSSPSLSNNQLCPQYPSCIEDDVGGQDLINCEGIVELWGEYYSIEYTTELVLSNRGLTGEIPPGIGNLTNLTYLDLYNNQLSGSIASEIGNLTNLTILNLQSNQLTGSIPSEIGNLTNLTYLDLYNNQLSGSIPPEIGNLTNLTILNLRSNQLTGSILSEIDNLTNLTYLNLRENQFTGSIPPQIGNLTNLTYMDLKSNDLTGSIPSGIGNLTNLTYLDLRWNDLTGSIPPQIGNLTNLTYLFLSSNDLTSFIPPEIGNLTNLEWLWLNNNQLTGIIPDEICNQGDSSPNLYNNQLCPPYPSCIEDYVGEQDASNCGD